MKLCEYCESALYDRDDVCIVCGGTTFRTKKPHISRPIPSSQKKNDLAATKDASAAKTKPDGYERSAIKSEPSYVERAAFCTVCGSKAGDGITYCEWCGHELETIKR